MRNVTAFFCPKSNWFFIVFICSLLSSVGYGKLFEYHHASPFALGVGVNLEDPSEPQRRCLDFEEERIDGESARKSEIRIRVVTSKKELFRELGVSASVAARSFFVNGDAGVTFANEASFEEDSLVWLIIGTVDFGRVRTQHTKLKPFAEQMLRESRHEDFQKQCGMSYVSQEKRGASVFALYVLKNLSSQEKKDMRAWLNVHTSNIPFVNGDIESKFSNALAEFQRNKQLSFRIEAVGGKGMSALAEVPKYENDIQKIREIVGNYLGGLTLKNAVPMEFLTSTYEQFGWRSNSLFNWNKRDLVLSEYYFAVVKIQSERQRLASIINSHATEYPHLSWESIEGYQSHLAKRDEQIEKLMGEAENCVNDPNACRAPRLELDVIIWPRSVDSLIGSSRVWRLHLPEITNPTEPELNSNECERERLYASRIGCVGSEELKELHMIRAAPLCSSTGELVSLIYCK